MMGKNKAIVATVCVIVSVGAIVGGVYLRSSTAPLAMPANVDEALEGLKSDAYERMDDQRRQQYAAEAMRLMGELSDEERQAMREQFRDDEEMRDAMRKAWEDRFEDMVRKAARGEGMETPMFRPPAGGRERPNPDEMTDEEREEMEARRENMRERIAEQIKDNWESGDAQSSGLRQEFFANRGSGSGGGGGGGRRGGGGR